MDITLQTLHSEDPPVKRSRLLDLQGECRIISLRALQIDWLKAILLMIPLTISVVGLLLLKYFKKMRVAVFYKSVPYQEVQYVFIQGTGGVEDVERVTHEDGNPTFHFKKLKYFIEGNRAVPAGFLFEDAYQRYFSKEYFQKGTDQEMRLRQLGIYGTNEHKVETPFYFQYLFDVMLKPFFLLQYAVCIIYFLQGLATFSILMLAFSLLTTTINYILLVISYQKIKQIAEKVVQVRVIRDGAQATINNTEMLPGDIYIPEKGSEVLCDAIMIAGEAFVNQASLTGESIPIGKFAVENPGQCMQDNRWLYQGAKVLECRNGAIALVVNVGYATRRGRIIRKILTRIPKDPDFFITAVYFLLETLIVGIIIYGGTFYLMNMFPMATNYKAYRFLDFVAWCFPPMFPTYFNLAYSFSLIRLRSKGIVGTEPEKTVDGAKLKTMCFDKTGTLTQNAVQVYQITKFIDESTYEVVTNKKTDESNTLLWKLFACCHTVKNIDGEMMGDEVDLRMFLFSDYEMSASDKPEVKFVVKHQNGQALEILRINQFESQFQNMSVLVRDIKANKHYAFLKGAPEKIDRNSILKVKQYENLVANLSLGGYRTIGFGYRQVQEGELQQYLTGAREIFDKGIRALGLVAFENKLKPDTNQTITRLNDSCIQSKMITGDNIYIAVETGVRAGILKKGEKIILIEGRKQKFAEGKRVFEGILLERTATTTTKTEVMLEQDSTYLSQQYSIAVDNDFLLLKPEPFLTDQIKLYSRISPQNKALVVKRLKEQIDEEYSRVPGWSRFFGGGKMKVGMCGDGANDLMAIRESDVGLGISDSDASYGASFGIVNLMDVDSIIRESKSTSQIIVEMIRYFGSVSFLKVVASILMMYDSTYFGAVHVTYFNFAHTIWIPVIYAISTAYDQPTPYRPLTNMMSLLNHLVYYSNVIFPSCGFIAAYFYFIQTSTYMPNGNPIVTSSGYNSACMSETIIWLMINLPMIGNAFTIFTSHPFKHRIYYNVVLVVFLSLNIIAAVVFYFITPQLVNALGTVAIDSQSAGAVLGINAVFLAANWLANLLINMKEMYKTDQDRKLADLNMTLNIAE